MTRLSRLALVLVVALAAVGCGKSERKADTKPQSTLERSKVSITTDGSVKIKYSAVTDVTLAKFRPSNSDVSFVSAGLKDFKTAGTDGRFRAAFTVVGSYHGGGTYKVSGAPSGPTTTVASAGALSEAFVYYLKLKDPALGLVKDNVASEQHFDRVQKPCTVTINESGDEGSMRCPELADGKGSTISARMTWKPAKAAN